MTERRLVLDHERVIVAAVIDIVNDARKVQCNFLKRRKEKRVVT